MKSDTELKEIAMGIVNGTIVSSITVQDKELAFVFMPLGFMNKEMYKKFMDQKPGMIYEYADKALPRSANGMPIFPSMKLINITEFTKVKEYIEQLKKWSENNGQEIGKKTVQEISAVV